MLLKLSMQIVILCGGHGSRLGQLSKNIPKSLLKVNGIPFMKYLIDSLIPFNPSSIHLCLGKFSEQILTFLENENYDLPISFSIENENNLLGTGGALKHCLDYLNDNFIVQYGDTILDLDYLDLYHYHLKEKKEMTLSILPKSLSNETPNVLCCHDESGDLKCIYDKNNLKNTGNFIDYGAIVFKKKVFMNDLPSKFDLSIIQSSLSQDAKSSFYVINKKYIEIGSINSFYKAAKELKNV